MQGSARIAALVVDDNEDAAESFARVLELLGCEAVFVTDPRKALDEAARLKPHVAFLDIGMPHIDGYQLARALRARFGEDGVKLVAVTAYGTTADRVASRKAGFDAHVAKPVDPALVESIIRTVLPES
jgi:CheY-like chemotaxis protein